MTANSATVVECRGEELDTARHILHGVLDVADIVDLDHAFSLASIAGGSLGLLTPACRPTRRMMAIQA